MKTTVDNVLRLAGVTLVDISLAEHQNGYTNLNIRMDNDRVVGASLTWSVRETANATNWVTIYSCGMGNNFCQCDRCSADIDPLEWIRDDEAGLKRIKNSIADQLDEIDDKSVCRRCCELFEPESDDDELCDDCVDQRYCRSCHRWGHKTSFSTTWELGVKIEKCVECLFDLEV